MGVASVCGEQEAGVASGCGCKEVYRFPHTTYPYILILYLFFFAAASLLFVLFLMFFVLVPLLFCNSIICIN